MKLFHIFKNNHLRSLFSSKELGDILLTTEAIRDGLSSFFYDGLLTSDPCKSI